MTHFAPFFAGLHKFDTDLSILDGAQTVSESVLQSGSPALFTNAECRRCPWISSMRVFASDFLLKRTKKKAQKKNSNWKCVFITLRIHPKNQPLQLQNTCNAILATTVHYCATIDSNRIDCIFVSGPFPKVIWIKLSWEHHRSSTILLHASHDRVCVYSRDVSAYNKLTCAVNDDFSSFIMLLA